MLKEIQLGDGEQIVLDPGSSKKLMYVYGHAMTLFMFIIMVGSILTSARQVRLAQC